MKYDDLCSVDLSRSVKISNCFKRESNFQKKVITSDIYMPGKLVNILIILMKVEPVKTTANQCEYVPALRPRLTPWPLEWPSGQRSPPKVNYLWSLHWTESSPWIHGRLRRLWESWRRPLGRCFPKKVLQLHLLDSNTDAEPLKEQKLLLYIMFTIPVKSLFVTFIFDFSCLCVLLCSILFYSTFPFNLRQEKIVQKHSNFVFRLSSPI